MASSSRCAMCLRCFSVTSSSLVHTHGPTNSRCPGSNKPHASSSQPQPPSVQYIRATTERSSVGRSASQSQSPTASSTRDSAARAFAAMHTTSCILQLVSNYHINLAVQCLLRLKY